MTSLLFKLSLPPFTSFALSLASECVGFEAGEIGR
jgi:hypothetical protein